MFCFLVGFLWYLCYYPHTKDSLSLEYRIFIKGKSKFRNMFKFLKNFFPRLIVSTQVVIFLSQWWPPINNAALSCFFPRRLGPISYLQRKQALFNSLEKRIVAPPSGLFFYHPLVHQQCSAVQCSGALMHWCSSTVMECYISWVVHELLVVTCSVAALGGQSSWPGWRQQSPHSPASPPTVESTVTSVKSSAVFSVK